TRTAPAPRRAPAAGSSSRGRDGGPRAGPSCGTPLGAGEGGVESGGSHADKASFCLDALAFRLRQVVALPGAEFGGRLDQLGHGGAGFTDCCLLAHKFRTPHGYRGIKNPVNRLHHRQHIHRGAHSSPPLRGSLTMNGCASSSSFRRRRRFSKCKAAIVATSRSRGVSTKSSGRASGSSRSATRRHSLRLFRCTPAGVVSKMPNADRSIEVSSRGAMVPTSNPAGSVLLVIPRLRAAPRMGLVLRHGHILPRWLAGTSGLVEISIPYAER